ncbi:MAG: cytochrome c biogenesis protein CcsA [Candidatus Omnitrophica bacterium]|nr:cytochrome c biogenesis protein CcsA [Candidatus Omnitrophota bacterium]
MIRKVFSIQNIFMLLLLSSLIFPSRSYAQGMCPLDTLKPKKVGSLESFKRIPVLNQGRIKPLESYAQNLLLLFSGKTHYKKETAVEWLARFLFAPRTTFNDKIFLINSPEIAEALKIEPDKHRRYSYNQLSPGYDKLKELAEAISSIDEKNQSVVDKEILRVYSNVLLFLRLSGAFTFAVPHPDFYIESAETRALLNLDNDQTKFSFYNVLEKSEPLSQVAKTLETKEHLLWTDAEKDIGRILSALDFWSQHYSNCPLGLIPTQSPENEEWLSPMDTILGGFFDPAYKQEIKALRDMAVAYWDGSQLAFDINARMFSDSVSKRLSPTEKKITKKIPLELLYNQFNFLAWAKLFYALGFFIFLFSLTFKQKKLYQAAVAMTILGFIPHALALILRISILSRPPVSNLFETFVFVGLICVFLGCILEVVNKNWLGLVVANTCGFILLTIAGKYSAEGDTMQVLIAVLNSNFWLSTHVLAITIGYAGCCVAGIMGHIYILQLLAPKSDAKNSEITYKCMLGILGFGLTMTFLGTTLGGIWADQSWGRFWGWDPKENGALMIVLWCSIIFHSRIAKIINPLGAAVGCILALVNVMWAWFGVNLLSVGLHSYGFTSGIATTLGAYVVIELLFIAVSVIWLGKKNIKF